MIQFSSSLKCELKIM